MHGTERDEWDMGMSDTKVTHACTSIECNRRTPSTNTHPAITDSASKQASKWHRVSEGLPATEKPCMHSTAPQARKDILKRLAAGHKNNIAATLLAVRAFVCWRARTNLSAEENDGEGLALARDHRLFPCCRARLRLHVVVVVVCASAHACACVRESKQASEQNTVQ